MRKADKRGNGEVRPAHVVRDEPAGVMDVLTRVPPSAWFRLLDGIAQVIKSRALAAERQAEFERTLLTLRDTHDRKMDKLRLLSELIRSDVLDAEQRSRMVDIICKAAEGAGVEP